MTAWKDLERRVARALGGERNGPRPGSDVVGTPFSVEVKRTTRYCLRSTWIAQARRQGKAEGKPWLLVIGQHNDRRPLVVMDFWVAAEMAQRAGLIPTPLEVPGSTAEERTQLGAMTITEGRWQPVAVEASEVLHLEGL